MAEVFVPEMSYPVVPGAGKPLSGEQEQEIEVMRVCTGMGRGKSTLLADFTIHNAVYLFGDEETGGSNGLIITNMHFIREHFPSSIRNIEIFYDGNIRHIVEKLSQKKACIMVLDELDKGISSSKSASTANQIIRAVASDSRKYLCKLLIYSSIPRKGVDSQVRASDTFVMVPRHLIDVGGFAMFWRWDDPELFETDYTRLTNGEVQYRSGVPGRTTYQLSYLQTVFKTLDRIPINFDGLIDEDEIGPFTQNFLDWCHETKIDLVGMSAFNVKKFLSRWNSKSGMLLPLSPKNLDLIITEIIRLKVLEEPDEFKNIPIAEEPIEQPVSEPQAVSVALVPERPVVQSIQRGMVGFCCGKMQKNMYVHRNTKKHLKSVSTGVGSANNLEIPRPD